MSVTMASRRPQKRRAAALAITAAAADLAATAAAAAHDWSLNVSPQALAVWAAAAVLAVALVVAVTRTGHHAGWFHPLSLPLAVIAVMSLGAPLWVYFTREPAGLLAAAGQPPASALSAVMSVTACEALVLAVAGYLAGAVVSLAVVRRVSPALPGRWPGFRYGDLRRRGSAFMLAGMLAQAMVAVAGAGAVYGADQVHYGPLPLLAAGAGAAVLAGLVTVTVASTNESPRHLRDLLRKREWVVLGAYLGAVMVTGDRAGLIAPAVWVAWSYSTRVRPISLRGALAAALVALIAGAALAAYRAGTSVPGSPSGVMRSAAGDVSSPAWLTQETVMNVPSEVPFLHGSTYAAAAEAQLPGPVSRHLGATSRTATAVFRNLIGFSDPDEGFAESLPSEAYLNFGLGGCLAAGFLLGALTGWAWRRCRRSALRPRDVLYPVLLTGFAYGIRSDALTQVKDVLYPMLAVWVLMGWCRLQPQPRNGTRPSRQDAAVAAAPGLPR
jgi:hypothetical protein